MSLSLFTRNALDKVVCQIAAERCDSGGDVPLVDSVRSFSQQHGLTAEETNYVMIMSELVSERQLSKRMMRK